MVRTRDENYINICAYKERLKHIRRNPESLSFYKRNFTVTLLEYAIGGDIDILFKLDHTRISVPVLQNLLSRRKNVYRHLPGTLLLKLENLELYTILFL